MADTASAQTISTIAGNLSPGYSGDGGPATSAQLDRPFSAAVDGKGNVFVADQLFNVIRQFTVGGNISTAAGIGNVMGGFSGDGGAATSATLSGPAGIAVDSSGRVYVADAGNRRIRMFTPGGSISTVAGGGGASGADGLGDGGPATAANLAFPQGVAVDGNRQCLRGRHFRRAGADVHGRRNDLGRGRHAGHAGLRRRWRPGHLGTAVLARGGRGRCRRHVFVADNGSHIIREFTVGGAITTIAGTPEKSGYGGDGGPATAALLHGPSGVSVDGAGNVFIADTENGVVRKVAPGGVISTVAGGGTNPGSNGVGDGGPAPLAALSSPATVVPDGNGNILVADTGNDLIRSLSATVPAPSLVAAVLPGARSVLDTGAATIFATMLNATGSALNNCQISLPTATTRLLQLNYQTTNPATNALIGTLDTPATIAANGEQTFLLSFSAGENTGTLFSDPGQQMLFACDGVDPAATTQGVNTVDLSFSPTPVADVIALAAVASNDGILNFPTAGAGAFAVASDNVGSADTLTVSVDTGSTALPLALSICATNAGAQCLATPAASVTQSFAAGSAPTFSVFATASSPVGFAPATSRIFVRFKDSSGASHGSTSVAVETH
ncbi:MAG: hypothetical protein WDN69_35670 [Aliidongia sp.]